MLEPIKSVILCCRNRLDRALDCNIADVNRIFDELENIIKVSKDSK